MHYAVVWPTGVVFVVACECRLWNVTLWQAENVSIAIILIMAGNNKSIFSS